jgi:signal transduction histidine kinase
MKIPIEKKVFAGFFIAVSILGLFGLYTYLINRSFIETSRLVSHTNEVLFQIERVLSISIDLETGKRGYLLTGNEKLLEPNLRARQIVHEQINGLRKLTADNVNQQRRIQQLRSLVDENIEMSVKGVHERKLAMLHKQDYKFLDDKFIMARIRGLIEEMQKEENNLLKQRMEVNNNEMGRFNIAFLCLVSSIVVILIILFFTIKYHVNALNTSQIVLVKQNLEIENLNKNLSSNLSQLESSNKELEAFTYSVSHDLRAPLRSISGYAKILNEDYGSGLDEEGKKVIDIVVRNASKMGNLIDDLLDFSRFGKKEMIKSRINMSEMVRLISNDLNTHRAEVVVMDLEPTVVDVTMIKQVWINLISNAFKYSRNKEKIRIEIGSDHNGEEDVFFIKDNGIGFDMRYVHKLFGVFQRLHKVHEFEGTGVGLAIVQRIIQRHGGKVWAEGKVNEGAVFYFSIPKLKELNLN